MSPFHLPCLECLTHPCYLGPPYCLAHCALPIPTALQIVLHPSTLPKDRRKVFFGQQFNCSLRTDRSTKFGRSWTLICSNQVLTACGLHCLIIIFNGLWGCPLIAGERKTVAYSSIIIMYFCPSVIFWYSFATLHLII